METSNIVKRAKRKEKFVVRPILLSPMSFDFVTELNTLAFNYKIWGQNKLVPLQLTNMYQYFGSMIKNFY